MSTARAPGFSVLYGGAHLFKEGTAAKLGAIAKKTFEQSATDPAAFGACFEIPDSITREVIAFAARKFERGAIDAQVVDFEDGYGFRNEDEERRDAERSAAAVASDHLSGQLAPSIGLRVRAWRGANDSRGKHTLRTFVSTLVQATGGKLPNGFSVTLPKVASDEDVTELAGELSALERTHALPPGSIALELMIETPRALIDDRGVCPIPKLLAAAAGRCVAVHLGAYDLLSALDVAAPSQGLGHPACVLARQTMKIATAGTGVRVVDGATNELPIAPHLEAGWKKHALDTRRALAEGISEGWVLHPAQLVSRYVACCTYFRAALPSMSERLRGSLDKTAQANRIGSAFDDAASVEGLVRFFATGFANGVVDEDEVTRTGLRIDELAPFAWRARYG